MFFVQTQHNYLQIQVNRLFILSHTNYANAHIGGRMFQKPYEVDEYLEGDTVADCVEWQMPPAQTEELPRGLIGDEI
jgi:hypothetical protein